VINIQLCTTIEVLELSEPDMFGQVWVTDAKVMLTSVVGDDHRHELPANVKVGDFICVRSGPVEVKTPSVGEPHEQLEEA